MTCAQATDRLPSRRIDFRPFDRSFAKRASTCAVDNNAGSANGVSYQVQGIESSMDFVSLLRHVPQLLFSCINDDKIGPHRPRALTLIVNTDVRFRVLRLLSKECSKVALTGLRFFSLNLRGSPHGVQDTNIHSAKLLQHACLQSLDVKLLLSGDCCEWCEVCLKNTFFEMPILAKKNVQGGGIPTESPPAQA